jgi:hypothetical protein
MKIPWRRVRIPPGVQSERGRCSNTSTVTLRVAGGDEKGSLKIWDSKIRSRVPRDSDPRNTALASASSIYKREDAPLKQDRKCQTVINIWSWAPDGARHQDLLTVKRNVTWTSHEAPRYAVLFSLLSLHLSSVQIFSTPCSQTPSVCVPPLISENKLRTDIKLQALFLESRRKEKGF